MLNSFISLNDFFVNKYLSIFQGFGKKVMKKKILIYVRKVKNYFLRKTHEKVQKPDDIRLINVVNVSHKMIVPELKMELGKL